MVKDIKLPAHLDKREIYRSLLTQLEALIEGERSLIANLANLSAAIKEHLQFLWVGFYLIEGNEMVLGPFQGPVACTRIKYGKGVCGKSWELRETICVPNVHEFPGHIACSALSQSEIVVPFFNDEELVGVLDVDSEKLAAFGTEEQTFFESVSRFLTDGLSANRFSRHSF